MASAPESQNLPEKLSLYCRDWCGACFLVKRQLPRLNVEVEIRDVFKERQHYEDLINARGRGTVPVLRRDYADGTSDWMPESRDIVRYLAENYAG